MAWARQRRRTLRGSLRCRLGPTQLCLRGIASLRRPKRMIFAPTLLRNTN
uniref:Uncharacterized protein n=1 Tax=Arundo donax TaxID=35708 RepID=A0A0A9HHC2_ARUDO